MSNSSHSVTTPQAETCVKPREMFIAPRNFFLGHEWSDIKFEYEHEGWSSSYIHNLY